MKAYYDLLLAFVRALTDANEGQMTLERLGPDTYPDPKKTSYNDMVMWRISLTFGSGYFSGAMVRFVGRWTYPHPKPKFSDDHLAYSEMERDLAIDEAVGVFLSDTIPDWALPESTA